jgi:hypothetical protein
MNIKIFKKNSVLKKYYIKEKSQKKYKKNTRKFFDK